MMTMEQIKAEQKRLNNLEYNLMKQQRIDRMERILNQEHFMVTLGDATTTLMGDQVHVCTVLNDAEQTALAKSILVILAFAKDRLVKEAEGKQE